MLARFFIDRPVLAWVISIVIVLMGLIASGLLPIAQYPDVTQPTLPDVVKTIGVTVKKRSPDILLVVNLYLEAVPGSDTAYRDQLYLSNYATIELLDALARVEGVGDVFTFGGQDYSMRVWLDP